MQKKDYIFLVFAVIFCLGCEKEIDLKLSETKKNHLVFNGSITNELKRHFIQLSKPVRELNGVPEMVGGAKVSVRTRDTVYVFLEDSLNPGIYRSQSSFIGVVGKGYSLEILLGGKAYKAVTYMKAVTPNRPLKYHQLKVDTGKTVYYQLDENDAELGAESFMRELYFNWSKVSGFEHLDTTQTQALVYAYSFNSIGVNQIFKPEKKTVIFPRGTTVKVKKYSLTDEHAKYLRAVLSETDWKGGFFDQFSANPPTNLSEGALGFFGMSSVVVDSVVIQ